MKYVSLADHVREVAASMDVEALDLKKFVNDLALKIQGVRDALNKSSITNEQILQMQRELERNPDLKKLEGVVDLLDSKVARPGGA